QGDRGNFVDVFVGMNLVYYSNPIWFEQVGFDYVNNHPSNYTDTSVPSGSEDDQISLIQASVYADLKKDLSMGLLTPSQIRNAPGSVLSLALDPYTDSTEQSYFPS